MVLLLAPYNDAMQLGQGFNSFLQQPRMERAVDIPAGSEALRTQAAGRAGSAGAAGVSQVVSYSSRFVSKISEVVRSMNISAAASIKSGTVEMSGNTLSVDEAKFAASDMNAVVSVKVINQTTTVVSDAKFLELDGVKMDSAKFFDLYGDCYISGFMEGGDLHGIVSMKVLDVTQKSRVESALKGAMNGSAGEFTLSEGGSSSMLDAALRETETTISVNWSGGGQIKPDADEWTLDSLVRVASAFPGRVANCPQRTWAILTPYYQNRSFLKWADKEGIKVPNFSQVQQYTSDLLDAYMEHKNNVTRIQAVIANPMGFKLSPYNNALNLNVEALVAERKLIKDEMKLISGIIDELNKHPDLSTKTDIQSAEVWATRLPVPIDEPVTDANLTAIERARIISGFSLHSTKDEPKSSTTPSSTTIQAKPAEDALEPTKPTPKVDDVTTKAVGTSTKTTTADVANPIVLAPTALPITTVASATSSLLDQTKALGESLQPSPAQQPLPRLHHPDMCADIPPEDLAFVTSDSNRQLYRNYRFSQQHGSRHHRASPFNDAVKLATAPLPATWPQRIEVRMGEWNGEPCVRFLRVVYAQIGLAHGTESGGPGGGEGLGTDAFELLPGEKIVGLGVGRGRVSGNVEGVVWIGVETDRQRTKIWGDRTDNTRIRQLFRDSVWDGMTGLKGFWGGDGQIVDRFGAIWGKD